MPQMTEGNLLETLPFIDKLMLAMKKILTAIFLCSITYATAQELTLPTFTQYLSDNPFIISPARECKKCEEMD